MAFAKLSKLEMRVMDALWSLGPSSIRELQQAFPDRGRPAYSTIQTIVYRLEAKKAVRRAKRISNADIFDAVLTRAEAQRTLVDSLLEFFGGKAQPVFAHLIDTGKLTLDDVKAAEKVLAERRGPKRRQSG